MTYMLLDLSAYDDGTSFGVSAALIEDPTLRRNTLADQLGTAQRAVELAKERAHGAEQNQRQTLALLASERRAHRKALRARDSRIGQANLAGIAIAAELLDGSLDETELRRRIAKTLVEYGNDLGLTYNIAPMMPALAELAQVTSSGPGGPEPVR